MAERYADEIARKSLLQMCRMNGFDACSDEALGVLSDVMRTYVQEVCVTAKSYAEIAGRTEINAEDVVLGLGDMGTELRDLKEFKESLGKDGVPFAAPVEKFPVPPPRKTVTSFKDAGEEPPKHIPDFMPVFPPKHTFQHTPVYPNHKTDARTRALRAHEAKRAAEDVLVRLSSNTANDLSVAANPFLASFFDQQPPQPPPGDNSGPQSLGETQQKELNADGSDSGTKKVQKRLGSGVDPLAGVLGGKTRCSGKRVIDAFSEQVPKEPKKHRLLEMDASQFSFRVRELHPQHAPATVETDTKDDGGQNGDCVENDVDGGDALNGMENGTENGNAVGEEPDSEGKEIVAVGVDKEGGNLVSDEPKEAAEKLPELEDGIGEDTAVITSDSGREFGDLLEGVENTEQKSGDDVVDGVDEGNDNDNGVDDTVNAEPDSMVEGQGNEDVELEGEGEDIASGGPDIVLGGHGSE